MKKLGLCVRYDCNNYGSMLQIFATQKVIEECGWNYEIIRYDKKNLLFLVKNMVRVFNPYFMKGKILATIKKIHLKLFPEINKKNELRQEAFRKYRNDYIGPYSKVYKGYKELVINTDNYDAIMVGSDQLWTPAGIRTQFYNLLFVPEQIKKISLATSFGVTKIPKQQKKLTEKYLKRIDYLSVREISGADIVEELTGTRPLVAVDPTLFFDKDEWNLFFKNKKVISEPYIFAYFLGTNEKHRELVSEFAKGMQFKIITCPCMDEFVKKDLSFGDEQRFDINPIDFLNLIRNAEYIFTDSFHGSVFSILYHKKFLTFDRYNDELRKSKNTRIDSLFSQLMLERRHITNDVESIREIMEEIIDYDLVDKRLEKIRKDSFNFLKDALECR